MASPKPAVQTGGISAVAIATPGNAAAILDLLIATIPAIPPKKAIIISSAVGFILDNNSAVGFPKGVTKK